MTDLKLDYDASNTYPDTLEDGEAAIGKRAMLHLTGTIVDTGQSNAGTWVRFEIDERWGFPIERFVLDLAALDIEE